MSQKSNKNKRSYHKPRYRVGDSVYMTAFLKKYPGKFFVCKAVIEKCPEPNSRRVYKIKIMAVADAAIGSQSSPSQASLLGRSITKRENEINLEIPLFMQPEGWIESSPDSLSESNVLSGP